MDSATTSTPVSAYKAFLAARRAWYAEVISDPNMEVETTYVARFSATYVLAMGEKWVPLKTTTSQDLALPVDGPLDGDPLAGFLSSDGAGGYFRDADGYVVRDPRRVAKLMAKYPPWAQQLAVALFPVRPAKRRRGRHNIARAFLYASLAPRLGARAAAREILRWEDDLGAEWRVMGTRREETMIRSCTRAASSLPEPWRSEILSIAD